MFYIYIIFDFAMAVIMLLFGIWFYRSKGQASNFLSGYNMKSAEERKKYDENAMCKAYGKRMMLMSLPFIAGTFMQIFWQWMQMVKFPMDTCFWCMQKISLWVQKHSAFLQMNSLHCIRELMRNNHQDVIEYRNRKVGGKSPQRYYTK